MGIKDARVERGATEGVFGWRHLGSRRELESSRARVVNECDSCNRDGQNEGEVCVGLVQLGVSGLTESGIRLNKNKKIK